MQVWDKRQNLLLAEHSSDWKARLMGRRVWEGSRECAGSVEMFRWWRVKGEVVLCELVE